MSNHVQPERSTEMADALGDSIRKRQLADTAVKYFGPEKDNSSPNQQIKLLAQLTNTIRLQFISKPMPEESNRVFLFFILQI